MGKKVYPLTWRGRQVIGKVYVDDSIIEAWIKNKGIIFEPCCLAARLLIKKDEKGNYKDIEILEFSLIPQSSSPCKCNLKELE